MKLTTVLPALLITGCATTPGQDCHAPAFGLNSAHWRPAAADLRPCAYAARRVR